MSIYTYLSLSLYIYIYIMAVPHQGHPSGVSVVFGLTPLHPIHKVRIWKFQGSTPEKGIREL